MDSKIKRHRVISAVFIGICLLIQVGCASLTPSQRMNIANFSNATVTLGDLVSEELLKMREATIQMNTYRINVVGEEPGLPGINDLDEKFDVEHVKVRIQAVEALKSYGQLLQALIETTPEDDLKKASDSFISSFNSLPGSIKKIDDQQAGMMGQAVYQLGKWLVNAKKAKIIQDVVTRSKDQVEHLCNLLRDEFDVSKARLLTQYKKTANVAVAAIKLALLETHEEYTDDQLREIYTEIQTHRQRVKLVGKNMSEAIENMRKANEALYRSVEEGGFPIEELVTDLSAYNSSVKELVDTMKILGQSQVSTEDKVLHIFDAIKRHKDILP